LGVRDSPAGAMGIVAADRFAGRYPDPDRKRIMLIHALGCLGAALSMSLSWPQVVKSCVQRRTNGLSATACTLGVALPVGWITYGLLSGERIQIVTNTVTGTTGLAILAALLITQPAMRSLRAMRVSVGVAAVVIGVALLSGLAAALPGVSGKAVAPLLGLFLAGISFVNAVPQPLALLRDRTQDLSGLSPLRWRLAAGACASWMLYGVGTGQAAVWSSAAVGLLSSAIVCAVLHLRRERTETVLEVTYVTQRRWQDSITTRNLAMAGV
jgi:uncharacterized protein with PQ loop repeat